MECNDTALKRKLQQRVLRLNKKRQWSKKDGGLGRRLNHEMFPHSEDERTDTCIFNYRWSATKHAVIQTYHLRLQRGELSTSGKKSKSKKKNIPTKFPPP